MCNKKRLALLAAIFLLTSCSLPKVKDYRAELAEIRSVAVVVYTVPEQIVYRKDPRESLKDNLFTKTLKLAGKAEGEVAATTAYDAFLEKINDQGLPFSIMSKEAMLENEKFSDLVSPDPDLVVGGLNLTKIDNMLSIFGSDDSAPAGAAPALMKSFGLNANSTTSREFIKKAIGALGVDAAIVVYDPGMSFYCKSCLLVPGAGATGTGTTGANYKVIIISKTGTHLLSHNNWFKKTSASAAMAASVINPAQHESLYVAHGEKVGLDFSNYFKTYMEKK